MAWEAGYRDVGWNMSFPNYPSISCSPKAPRVFIPSEARAEVLWKPLTVSYFVRSEASAPPLGTDWWERDVCSCLVSYRQDVSHSAWSR